MAKGLRSKVKRRIRTLRRQHYYEVEGKQKLQELSDKLHDPLYDMSADVRLPPNAYVEPSNPMAVFPQHKKPHIIDYRDHKMAGAGFASVRNFRKLGNARATQSKYADIIRTPEQVELDKQMVAMEK